MLKQVLDKWKILDLTPTKWKCQCGQVNDMEIDNCPVCGLKRDFILKKTPKD
jgi:rubrerythrin